MASRSGEGRLAAILSAMALKNPKPVIGLAGGIGSGKSWVARQLGTMGCRVIEADRLARQALSDPEVIEAIVGRWGTGVLDESGAVDRAKVASCVFEQPEERAFLEQLIHPRVAAKRQEMRKLLFADPETVAVVEDCPLLFESGLSESCDAVIFVDAPRSTRLKRVQRERHWDDQELERRENAQLPLDIKSARSDHIFINDSDATSTPDRLRSILDQILGSL